MYTGAFMYIFLYLSYTASTQRAHGQGRIHLRPGVYMCVCVCV